ncbi:translation initiation factor 2 [Moorella sulfitireducens (nom. illeg.)]|uniref:translation initiation factor 2 n=1 Tax=Neomoorella sulfitireducens TaxID=2972948 RepID=UPI0021ABDFCF|nr:translation initiation factor 2 [Moorella sulfitireducens]
MVGNDPGALYRRIQELESRVEQLRVSRRVLMRLVEKSENEKWEMVNRLRQEKEKLQFRNRRYARVIWEKNKELALLASKLHGVPLPRA